MATFDTTPADHDVLLIYGAGHVPGLLSALANRGYQMTARDWFTAHTERIAFTNLLDTAADWLRRAGARAASANR
jgi:hypothetical protein